MTGIHTDTLVLLPVRRHESMANLMPQATLQIIPGAGHLPPLEQPQAFTLLLRRWLSQPVSELV